MNVLAGITALVALAVFLSLLSCTLTTQNQPATQREATSPPEALAASPYPSPEATIQDEQYLPDKVWALLEDRSLFAGLTAVTLDWGKIWQVSPDGEVRVLTDFTDVAALFGWNQDGSKLLFGRGRYPTKGEHLSDSTELWVYDRNTGGARRLVDSTLVWTASWSPVDDRIAYCEFGYVLHIITLDGAPLQERKEIICDYTWSPDGNAMALAYSGADMVLSDGLRTSALAVWWLENDYFQLISQAKYESHSHPIWTYDGQRIWFQRNFTELSGEGVSGLYITDIVNSKILYIPDGPKYYTADMNRSSREDILVYRLGNEIYIMELDHKPVLIGYGDSPSWLPDGMTILYRSSEGDLQHYLIDTPLKDYISGGQRYANGVLVQPEFFFTTGSE